jgi:hypothetical protein
MRVLMASVAMTAGMMIAVTAAAQAPAGSTGECKDGSYTSVASKRGACAGHGGVKEWYSNTKPAKETAKSKMAAPAKDATSTTAPAAPASPTPSAKAAAAPAAAAPAAKSMAAPAAAAPAAGGGPGQVWVNTKSKVYHCSGSKWYGKTKEGEYMSEAAAKAAGNHPDHGKACS